MSPPVLTTTTMMMTMTMTIMAMKSEGEIAEVRASNGETVLLNSGLQTKQDYEVRWTHDYLLVTSVHTSECDGERCELLADGSLQLYRITGEYAGNYKLELFNSSGKLISVKEFLLRVDGEYAARATTAAGFSSDSGRSFARRSAAVCCSLMLLLLLVIPLCILGSKRRMNKGKPVSDQMESVYVAMHQSKISQEEDKHNVSCRPAVSTETDIYV